MNALRRSVTIVALAALWAAVGASSARAQKTILTITGFPLAFPSPTGADFFAGSITAAGLVTYTVDASTGTTGQRTATISIRCNAPCPQVVGPKALATLQWSRTDLGTWNTLTTTDTQVEQRAVFKGGLNDPFSNSIAWRFLLGWLTDPPGAATSFRILFTLTVTVP
jgi:hypothetical protein